MAKKHWLLLIAILALAGLGVGIGLSVSTSGTTFTFKSAYQSAVCGDTVTVPNGHYGKELIPYTVSKTCQTPCRETVSTPFWQSGRDFSGCVTFVPESKNGVTLDGLTIEVPYIRVVGMQTPVAVDQTTAYGLSIGANIGRINAKCSAWNVHDVVVDDWTGQAFTVRSSSYVTIEHSDFSNLYAGQIAGRYTGAASQVSPCKDATGQVTKQDHLALIDVSMHDYHNLPCTPTCHMEGIHWNQGDQGAIIDSRFWNIGQQDISFQNAGIPGATISDLYLASNTFGRACSNPDSQDKCGVVSGGTTTFICDGRAGVGSQITGTIAASNWYDPGGRPSYQKIAPCQLNLVKL